MANSGQRNDLINELFFEPAFMKGSENNELKAFKNKLAASSFEILSESSFSKIKERLSLLKREFAGMETDPLILVYLDPKKHQALVLAAVRYYNQVCLEEIERCKAAKGKAQKPKIKNELIDVVLDITSWLQGRGQPSTADAREREHELDYQVDVRAIKSGQQGHYDCFRSYDECQIANIEKPRIRKAWLIRVLALLSGMALGALTGLIAGAVTGAIFGPLTVIVGGVLGVIGGIAGAIVGFALTKPPKSNEYLHAMMTLGKNTFANPKPEDALELNYVLGELACCERGRKILRNQFGHFQFSEGFEEFYLPITRGKNKGSTPLDLLLKHNEQELVEKIREVYPMKKEERAYKYKLALQGLAEKDPSHLPEYRLLRNAGMYKRIDKGKYGGLLPIEVIEKEGANVSTNDLVSNVLEEFKLKR